MGMYFILIEDRLGVRLPHGVTVCGDGTRHRIENDDALRAWVLDLAGRIREVRGGDDGADPGQSGAGRVPRGMLGLCGQARV